MLLVSLALLVATLKPGVSRSLFMILVFFNWLPFRWSLAALQLEPLILLLLALTLLLVCRGTYLPAGVPVGVAAALKVYPGGLVCYFAVGRRWQAIAGVVVGFVATLGAAALILPVRHTFDYFFKILPRLGGVSLYQENLSALGNLGRLAVSLLEGREKTQELARQLVVLDDCGVKGALTLAVLLFVVLTLCLAFFTVRAIRGWRSLDPQLRESLGLALAVCLYVPMFPCSWANYQTLLALPFLVAVALAPAPRVDPSAWVLLALAAVPAVFVADSTALFKSYPGVCIVARSLTPLWLWWALLRIFQSKVAEELSPISCRYRAADSALGDPVETGS
jgi:hypothetical protein